jgi:GxxExxY protein
MNQNENDIAGLIVDAAFHIHQETGPGLLESVYEILLTDELERKGLNVERQKPMPIVFRGRSFDEGLRADLVVNGKVIVELKSVTALQDVHKKQLLTYLKLIGMKLGLLINFGEALIKNGITRVVNGL